MQKRVFWTSFFLIGLGADLALPFVWGLVATLPIMFGCWWFAYRSGWFD